MEIEEIVRLWRAEGIQLKASATSESIVEAEQLIGFTFPNSFKQFYALADGFDNHDWTSGMFYLWPIERIREEWNASSQKEFIPFCDYLINSHQIGFLKNKPGIFKQYGMEKEPEQPICEEFAEALELIFNDAPEVN